MSRSTDSRKLAVWRKRFDRFSRGEWAVGQFCAQERVSVASFYYWRDKVGESWRPGEDRPRFDRRSAFQPVAVVPAVAAVRIELPCGTRIEVGTGDLEVVHTVVAAVSRSDDARNGGDGAC